MSSTQEFLVLESDSTLSVYGVSDFPPGTVVADHARRLRVVGQGSVEPPRAQLTTEELERWTQQLARSGHTTTFEPFWR